MIYSITLVLLISFVLTQSVPESVQIRNLPNQTQEIYQGWLCVDDEAQSFLYYQLFMSEETKVAKNQVPLLLFLEGGPGDPSTQTVWADFGPYIINSNLNMTGLNNLRNVDFSFTKRKNSWTGPYHVLAIDSPVFTGYSFSETMTKVSTTAEAATHLVNFLNRFYQVHPDLTTNPLHIVGHSIGARWAFYLAYSLVKDYNLTLNNDIRVNLAGVIGLNPSINIRKQLAHADILFSAGLTDPSKRDFITSYENKIVEYIEAGEFTDASMASTEEYSYLLNKIPGLFFTSNATVDNIRRNHLFSNIDSLELSSHYLSPKFFFNLTQPGTGCALEVFNIPSDIKFFSHYIEKEFSQSGDLAIDLSYTIEYLLDQGINISLVAAQDDGTVPAPGVTILTESLKWIKEDRFRKSQRKSWYIKNGTLAGNYKKYENLNYVLLYNSGHVMTFDQPDVILEFIDIVANDLWK